MTHTNTNPLSLREEIALAYEETVFERQQIALARKARKEARHQRKVAGAMKALKRIGYMNVSNFVRYFNQPLDEAMNIWFDEVEEEARNEARDYREKALANLKVAIADFQANMCEETAYPITSLTDYISDLTKEMDGCRWWHLPYFVGYDEYCRIGNTKGYWDRYCEWLHNLPKA